MSRLSGLVTSVATVTPTGTQALPVRLTSVSKRYGRQTALQDVTLELHAGEVFGYLGPNGAGKTTTLRLLMGLLRPSSGSASICGFDSWRQAPETHRRVGYVPGDVALYDRMTGSKLLTYLGNLRGGVDHQRVRELGERLDAQLMRPLRTLSSGNRQKIAIIQAVMHRPPVLLLDEPTTGLDPLVQQQVHELLREHAAAGGTVLLSSHVLSEVQRVADRVGIIRAGELVAVERLDDLRRKSLHHLAVVFAEPVTPSDFVMDGVHDLVVRGSELICAATQTALDPLMRAVTRYRIVDLNCEEASLDETFLAYYGKGPRDAA